MTHTLKIIGVGAVVLLAGCQNLPQLKLPGGPRNVSVNKETRTEVKWCSLSPTREVACEVEMSSLRRNMEAGLSYPKMQDNKGREFRLKSERVRVMVPGQPYIITLTARNLPTDTTHVRNIVVTVIHKPPGRPGNYNGGLVTFSDIPRRQSVARASPAGPAAAAATGRPLAVTPPPRRTVTAAVPTVTAADGVSNSYWFGRIVPVVSMPRNAIIDLWRRGAYLHFRPDGIAGYNWSTPGGYSYEQVNRWTQRGNTFTLTMSGAAYTFRRSPGNRPLVTYIKPGGAFKMTMQPKTPGQR